MPVLDDARIALARLQSAESARTGIQEALALDDLRKTLALKYEALESVAARGALLIGSSVAVSVPSELSNARKTMAAVAGQFRDAPEAATLKKGRRWTGLIESIDGLLNAANNAQLSSWKEYFNTQLFGGRAPSEIKLRLAQTPSNNQALLRYAELYNGLAVFRNRVPSSKLELEQAQSLSKELERIKFDENVPEDVARFFAAAASGLGAPLELLTPEVIRWLRDNGLLDRYVVRGRAL